MANIGDRNAEFIKGAKVKIYLGPRFIGTGIVEGKNVPKNKKEKASYSVLVGDGEGQYFADELIEDKFSFGDISKIALKLLENNDGSFQAGEYWQAILNVGYEKWRADKSSPSWGYSDMIEWMRLEYGEFASFAILLGKYHQQVTNGGHIQYWDNKYAGDDEEDFSLHEDMVSFFGRSGLRNVEKGKKTYDVIKNFEIVFPDENSGWGDCHCDEEEYPHVKDSGLDEQYYEFCHPWAEECGAIFREAIDVALKEAKAVA